MYVAEVESFTHKCKNQVIVSKKFLSPDDHVLIIDDFLANGYALQGLISIVHEAGATVEGIGIVVEKGFQIGGQVIRNLGYHLESLAIVESMDPAAGTVKFRERASNAVLFKQEAPLSRILQSVPNAGCNVFIFSCFLFLLSVSSLLSVTESQEPSGSPCSPLS